MTRILEIDDDVYQYLLSQSRWIGENASSILRRLLGLSGSQSTQTESPSSNGDRPAHELAEFLVSAEFLTQYDTTNRYLSLLAFLYQENREKFEKVVGISGRSRVYIGRSMKQIQGSGRSTHPQRIPGSEYWALTNASNDQKKRILERVMRELDYPEFAVRRAAAVIK